MAKIRKPWVGSYVEIDEDLLNRAAELTRELGVEVKQIIEIADILEQEFELPSNDDHVSVAIIIAIREQKGLE